MELPNGQNAKISNVADDSTLILVKTRALEMRIVNSFKACPNKTKPLDLSVRKTPSNLWNILSHDETGKDNNNFHIKIRKMEAKLNIWPNAVGERTLLSKSFVFISVNQLRHLYAFCSRNSYSADAKKNYLHFFGRIKQIRSKDWFCSAHYPKVDWTSVASGLPSKRFALVG